MSDLRSWFCEQAWERDTGEPCVTLGPEGTFDDMHIFAPAALVTDDAVRLYYCGSSGEVDERVFRMGLSTGEDGRTFVRHPETPVLSCAGRASVLTPTFLRSGDGHAAKEGGRYRLWFSSTTFPPGIVHTIHESSSEDGVNWAPPSPPQIEGGYAPTVLKVDGRYLMWYTDVTAEPWCFRFASSDDGRTWRVRRDAVMETDQAWEHRRLFYPTVLRRGGAFLMWYGSYSGLDPMRTAIGFAASEDGVHWEKHPGNPVFGPDPSRDWESHYTTSQSVLTMDDGSMRMWYASRTKPPFTHKYFAIGTAVWRNAFRS